MATPKRINYLNNREILIEINKSKKSYCYFLDETNENFDIIVASLDEVNGQTIQDGMANRVRRFNQIAKAAKTEPMNISQVDPSTVIVRLMTHEHIPIDPVRAIKAKTEKDTKVKTNFPPFKHYFIKSMDIVPKRRKVEISPGVYKMPFIDTFENIKLNEAGRSHWKDGLGNGEFCLDGGAMTPRLALMFMKLVDRYGQRSNWRGYTYLDEMKCQALLQLSHVGLQFNEARSENPFAYYTATITNSFTRVLNIEKRNQNLRDDILTSHGSTPSFTKQLDHEIANKMATEIAKQLLEKGEMGPELDLLFDEYYDINTRKISIKKEEFRKIAYQHHKHFLEILNSAPIKKKRRVKKAA